MTKKYLRNQLNFTLKLKDEFYTWAMEEYKDNKIILNNLEHIYFTYFIDEYNFNEIIENLENEDTLLSIIDDYGVLACENFYNNTL